MIASIDAELQMIEQLETKMKELFQENEKLRKIAEPKQKVRDPIGSNGYESASSSKNESEEEQEKSRRSFVAVIIDADKTLFNLNLLAKGSKGGIEAAQKLLSSFSNHQNSTSASTIFAQIYMDKNAVVNRYGKSAQLSLPVVHSFIEGFNDHTDLMNIVPCGDTESKVKAAIRFYGPLSSLLFVGGVQGQFYQSFFENFEEKDSEKIHFIRSNESDEFSCAESEVFEVSGLFEDPTSPVEASSFPAQSSNWRNQKRTPNGFTSHPSFKKVNVDSRYGFDLRKQNVNLAHLSPRPCHIHHISPPCSKARCDFSHDYVLNRIQIENLKNFAKSLNCKQGRDCTRDNCIYNHE